MDSTLTLEKDESFSLTAQISNPGYQSVVLKGYLIDRRADGTYVAPLIPQLFYGVNGQQLTTWRQYLPSAGSQVILSRSGGYPKVPREELYWQKISGAPTVEAKPVEVKPEALVVQAEVPWNWVAIGGLAVLSAAFLGYVVWKSRK